MITLTIHVVLKSKGILTFKVTLVQNVNVERISTRSELFAINGREGGYDTANADSRDRRFAELGIKPEDYNNALYNAEMRALETVVRM